MKIAIAGGGTGGHIYPGIAVAEEIVRRGGEAFFIGTERGLESKIVPHSGFPFRIVAAAPMKRGQWAQNAASLLNNFRGFLEARNILRAERPAAVLGTGGYVSFAACSAARALGLPLALHEQNAIPGLANRVLARFASVVMTAWSGVKTGTAAKVVGLPVRADFAKMNRAEARARLNLPPDARVLLVFGGSRGAASLNRAVSSFARKLENIHLIWATGADHYDAMLSTLGELPSNLRLFPYLDDMPAAFHAADLIVARSGAMTLAELAACGRPSILVPFPHATGDHQTANARAFVDAGAAAMIR
ncbi:MAG: undecaprenyldiphospho-muramoylpentapeptide beta-N-acetylglucosaminyltransferase, partial [Candidatus Hydrogenedentota bacterium]